MTLTRARHTKYGGGLADRRHQGSAGAGLYDNTEWRVKLSPQYLPSIFI